MHWVSVEKAVNAEVRLYDHLFLTENPDDVTDESLDWKSNLNPDSLRIVEAKLEPALADATSGYRCQFERQVYFFVDTDSSPNKLVFNRTVTLKDAWTKQAAKR